MSSYRPGEFRITDKAIKIWNLPKGAEILDIGCGKGETVEYLQQEYGLKARGIDVSPVMIKEGLARNPKLDLKFGDGEFLDEYSSHTFDGILMECVLSLINLPDEALHESFCVMKKGGRLFISDLYIKNPDKMLLNNAEQEAKIQQSIPHIEGGCSSEKGTECDGNHEGKSHDMGEHSSYYKEDHKEKAVNFRIGGRFLIAPLIALLEEIGYKNIVWEDCSSELDAFVAQKIMNGEPLEECFCNKGFDRQAPYKTGYFMLIAEK